MRVLYNKYDDDVLLTSCTHKEISKKYYVRVHMTLTERGLKHSTQYLFNLEVTLSPPMKYPLYFTD